MKINTTLLDLDIIYRTMSLSCTLKLLEELIDIKIELVQSKNQFMVNTEHIVENIKSYVLLEQQIDFVERNIKILEDAVLAHESEIFQRVRVMGKTIYWCFN